MHERTVVIDDDDESKSLQPQMKPDRKPTGDDPVADWLLKTYYLMCTD